MTTFKQKIKDWITPALVVSIGGAIITGIIFIFNAVVENNRIQVENKQLMFESVEQRVETKDHVNTPYNPVNAYKQSVELTEQTVKVDSALASVKKLIADKAAEKERVDASRSSRDSSQRVQAEAIQKILKLLDTTQ